jgi:hypothetical protein
MSLTRSQSLDQAEIISCIPEGARVAAAGFLTRFPE